MNKHSTLIILSIAIVIIPLLGFPGVYKSFFTIILGLVSGFISYRLYKQDLKISPKPKVEVKPTTYVDNLHP